MGTLNLVRITYNDLPAGDDSILVPPIVILRLNDRVGETTLEYEVPINFKVEKNASQSFLSMKIIKGNWIGLHFKKKTDYDELSSCLDELCNELNYD